MLGRFKKKELTKAEQDYIRDNYKNTSVREMARELELTYHNVSGFMKKKGWKRETVDRNADRTELRMERGGYFNYSGHENWIA